MGEVPISHQELGGMLSRALGEEKANEIVRNTAEQLSFGDPLTSDEALRLLDMLSKEEGIVGITARFVKTQVHLRHR